MLIVISEYLVAQSRDTIPQERRSRAPVVLPRAPHQKSLSTFRCLTSPRSCSRNLKLVRHLISTFSLVTPSPFISMAFAAEARALYRSFLRELPPRTPILTPSPIRTSIRSHFHNPSNTATSATISASSEAVARTNVLARKQEAEQFILYLQSQRKYNTLLERYNPGMGMDEEEKVRLSARRVGVELPVEWKIGSS